MYDIVLHHDGYTHVHAHVSVADLQVLHVHHASSLIFALESSKLITAGVLIMMANGKGGSY